MSSLSLAASVISGASSTTSSNSLVKTANGEYTAASVQKDQTDAAKLGLVKMKDGNYGTGQQTSSTTASAAARSSSPTQLALTTLTLGGS